jgi:MoaA/NifB/PqqE/SkfB family radical SAM enzyme
LNCAFCDTTDRHRPATNELSVDRQLEILEEAAALGVQRVFLLGGGEPLLSAATPKLMERTKELGLEGILTTNGTRFTDRLIDQVLTWGWDEIHFSVDGPSPEIHDALRGKVGAFRRTITTICKINVQKRIRGLTAPALALHFVLTNKNFHTLVAMVDLGRVLGVERIDFDALIAYRPEQLALELSEAQRAQVPAFAEEALKRAESLGIATTLEHFLDARTLERGAETSLPVAPGGTGLSNAPCLKAWHYLVVQSDGRTSPCCVLAGEGESVAEQGLEEVWRDGDFLNRVREGMLSGQPLDRCRECSANILAHERAIRSHL